MRRTWIWGNSRPHFNKLCHETRTWNSMLIEWGLCVIIVRLEISRLFGGLPHFLSIVWTLSHRIISVLWVNLCGKSSFRAHEPKAWKLWTRNPTMGKHLLGVEILTLAQARGRIGAFGRWYETGLCVIRREAPLMRRNSHRLNADMKGANEVGRPWDDVLELGVGDLLVAVQVGLLDYLCKCVDDNRGLLVRNKSCYCWAVYSN